MLVDGSGWMFRYHKKKKKKKKAPKGSYMGENNEAFVSGKELWKQVRALFGKNCTWVCA